jgi:hypothetical protein
MSFFYQHLNVDFHLYTFLTPCESALAERQYVSAFTAPDTWRLCLVLPGLQAETYSLTDV